MNIDDKILRFARGRMLYGLCCDVEKAMRALHAEIGDWGYFEPRRIILSLESNLREQRYDLEQAAERPSAENPTVPAGLEQGASDAGDVGASAPVAGAPSFQDRAADLRLRRLTTLPWDSDDFRKSGRYLDEAVRLHAVGRIASAERKLAAARCFVLG